MDSDVMKAAREAIAEHFHNSVEWARNSIERRLQYEARDGGINPEDAALMLAGIEAATQPAEAEALIPAWAESLSVRAKNAIYRNGLKTPEQVLSLGRRGLLGLRDVGDVTADCILAAAETERRGMAQQGEPSDAVHGGVIRALQCIACLGNGDTPGNSTGNAMALAALRDHCGVAWDAVSQSWVGASDAAIEAWLDDALRSHPNDVGDPMPDDPFFTLTLLQLNEAVALMRRNRQPADRAVEALRRAQGELDTSSSVIRALHVALRGLVEAVDKLRASENTERRKGYARAFADDDLLGDLFDAASAAKEVLS